MERLHSGLLQVQQSAFAGAHLQRLFPQLPSKAVWRKTLPSPTCFACLKSLQEQKADICAPLWASEIAVLKSGHGSCLLFNQKFEDIVALTSLSPMGREKTIVSALKFHMNSFQFCFYGPLKNNSKRAGREGFTFTVLLYI